MSDGSGEIAIIGAGPAGAHLAARLACAGRDLLLFDPRGAWEKPCGGGVPTRALREFSFLLEDTDRPRKLVYSLTMISPLNRRVTVRFKTPFAIFSRQELNGLLLDRALEAGARFIRAGVTDFKRDSDGWKLRTSDGQNFRARFLVGADGAASSTRRRLIGIFPKHDLALAFGYNIAAEEGDREEALVAFPRDFTGYLWAFPRPGAMNFGVASKLGEKTSDELRSMLTDFVRDYYGGRFPEAERTTFFGAKIPTLDLRSWPSLQATGEGWALAGDAAGFADPITGEGIFFALKSADLLADAICDSRDYKSANAAYDREWRNQIGRELEHASYYLPRFYHGTFMGHIFTDALVLLARFHRGVRTILIGALMGEQSYVTLKRDLLRLAWQIL
jgi:flavin-dependent dehydrogenase